jgi:hypothetical protein
MASAFGPLPFGPAFDLLDGYQEILLAIFIFPVLRGIACVLSPKPLKDNVNSLKKEKIR